jgi:site-specific DNA-methyltransferase (adenine-specific)/modification methylase
MVTKVQIGDATLYLGDCADILPTLDNIDAVVTDPPYGMNLNADFSTMNNKKSTLGVKSGNSYSNIIGDDKDFDPIPFLTAKNTIFFGADYFVDKLPKNGSISIWDKRINESGDKAFGSCYEMIWFHPARKKDFLRHCWYGVFGTEKEDVKKRVHPTQKPIGVMEWCISKLPKESNVILDPFMGSGTTGVACAKMGKTFIGIEKDPNYFKIACERIELAYAQPDMFI